MGDGTRKSAARQREVVWEEAEQEDSKAKAQERVKWARGHAKEMTLEDNDIKWSTAGQREKKNTLASRGLYDPSYDDSYGT